MVSLAAIAETERVSLHDGEMTYTWQVVLRERFWLLWEDLPQLTVISGLPGSGKTEWMRQCKTAHRTLHPSTDTMWLSCRRSVEAFFESPSANDARLTVFIDDVLYCVGDPLWTQIADALAHFPELTVVASSIDGAPLSLGRRVEIRQLDERDLAMTPDEVAAVATQNGQQLVTSQMVEIMTDSAGCPMLVRSYLESMRHQQQDGDEWGRPVPSFAKQMMRQLETLPREVRRNSAHLAMFERGSDLRRFTADMLADKVGVPADDELLRHFWRLSASPCGRMRIAPETGYKVFEWNSAVWQAFRGPQDEDDRLRSLIEGLRRTRAIGYPTTQLFYLLELGHLAEAERLVNNDLYSFFVFAPDVTLAALRDKGLAGLQGYPGLLLLLGEFFKNQAAFGPSTIMANHCYMDALKATMPIRRETGRDQIHALTMQAFAEVSLGDREHTVRHLQGIVEIIGDGTSWLMADDEAAESVDTRMIVSDLFIGAWVAIRVDDFHLAYRLMDLTAIFADPSSSTYQEQRSAVESLRILLGYGAGSPLVGENPGTTSMGNPFVLLSEGKDGDVLKLVRTFGERRGSHSDLFAQMNALVLAARLLSAPKSVTTRDAQRLAEESRRFWNDRQPGRLDVLVAILALVANGETGLAKQLRPCLTGMLWEDKLAQGLIALSDNDLAGALTVLDESSLATESPRALVLTGVLVTTAYIRQGNRHLAMRHLKVMWDRYPDGLIRFALRLMPMSDFETLMAWVCEDDSLSDTGLPDLLEASRGDTRPLSFSTIRISKAEQEILVHLRSGRTNKEIADLRFVSLSTVRTQVHQLLGKFHVGNRVELVATVEKLGVLDS